MSSARSENVSSALIEVLMEYYAVPGRFSLMLRQPLIAFQQFDKIILWAQGKIQEEEGARKEELRKASIFFVQRACFRLENTHYDVLGLDREFSIDVLRQRYRSLISLTHPDKNISGLPKNAAVRINNAYDILRNADERAKYDATLSNKIEVPSRTFSTADTSSINSVALKDRLKPYIPNFKQSIFVVIPIIFTLCVVVLLVFGSGPRDLELVEKKSNLSKKSNSLNSQDENSASSSIFVTSHSVSESGKSDGEKLVQSGVDAFEPISNVYHSIVRSVKPVSSEFTPTESIRAVSPVANAEYKAQINPEVTNSSLALKPTSNMLETSVPVVETNASRQNNQNIQNNVEVKAETVPATSQLAEARINLTQLISSLERPSEIEFLQSKMMRQGVSGNLFGVAMPQIRDAAVIKVDHFAFNEKLDKNHLVLNGNVSFMHATHAGQLTPYRYAVYAEFKNIDKNAAMSRFELREAK